MSASVRTPLQTVHESVATDQVIRLQNNNTIKHNEIVDKLAYEKNT